MKLLVISLLGAISLALAEEARPTCRSDQFVCRIGKCIPQHWSCDGDWDCEDGFDELDCTRTCGTNKFLCRTGRCVPDQWRCDGDPDCIDGSDELDCKPVQCEKGEFRCNNTKCITDRFRCDKQDDCGDNSDERGCINTEPVQCKKGEFKCNNSRCITDRWRCDKQDDCGDNSDERGCFNTTCLKFQFQCNNELCIHQAFKCDKENDCGDNSDELGCDHEACPDRDFKCGDGKCIPYKWVCDKDIDCNDKADERNCSYNATQCGDIEFECENKRCIHKSWKCDLNDDCGDNSDEIGCPTKDHQLSSTRAPPTTSTQPPLQCPSVPESTWCYSGVHNDECKVDSECPSGSMCCSQGCVNTCMDLSRPAKHGTCPYVRHLTGCPNKVRGGRHRCLSDSDCSGDRKCCFDGCNRKCKRPDSGTAKQGRCPVPQSLYRCTQGRRPTLTEGGCHNDGDCAGKLKCCQNKCGFNVCSAPHITVVKLETCPRLPETKPCPTRRRTKFCYKDNCRSCCISPFACNPYPEALSTRKECRRSLCAGKCKGQGQACVIDRHQRVLCVCRRHCPAPKSRVEAVCGDDDVTYRSRCHLERTSCYLGWPISVVYRGRCRYQDFPPLIVSPQHTSRVTLEIGKAANIACKFDGLPVVIYWSKRNLRRLPRGRMLPRGNTLTIRKVKSSDSGTYVCTAHHGLHRVSATVNVTTTDG